MNPLGLALIGCGDIAPRHAQSLQSTTNAKLVACMDLVEGSARSLGEEYHVPWFTRLDDLLALPQVEAVLIATPAFTHADLAEQAARAGKAVISEKPLAATLADADRMIAVCRELGRPLATCFPLRWIPGGQWARQLVQAGALGDITEIRLSDLGEKPESYWTGGYSGRTKTDWRKSKQASGGGVVITNLVHHLDLARFITGLEVTRAVAEAGTFCTQVEVEDIAVAALRYGNGAIGLIDGSSGLFGGLDTCPVVIVGTKGQIRLGFWNKLTEVYLTEAFTGAAYSDAPTSLPAREWVKWEQESVAWVDFHNAFAAAVREGRTPPVTGEDGRAALVTILAIYQSAETGSPVTL
jgi:predicted dehydrogenase